jgi:hypothetical protein
MNKIFFFLWNHSQNYGVIHTHTHTHTHTQEIRKYPTSLGKCIFSSILERRNASDCGYKRKIKKKIHKYTLFLFLLIFEVNDNPKTKTSNSDTKN